MPGKAGIFSSARRATPLAATFLQNLNENADLTTYTFAAQNLGPASTDRVIAVVVTGRQSSARTILSVTIGGVAATEVATRGSSQNPLGIWTAPVPSGTTGDIVVTFSGGMLRCHYGAWAIIGGAILFDSEFGTDTVTITGAAGGVVIAGACTTGASSFAWTNAAERFDLSSESFTSSGADSTAVGASTITATPGSASTNGIVAAAFTR